ncbi:unnamed protein product [Amoebophrya sp. A25]|nr:unnamed protein product [Amoebophrya sp. A25]|eukprot:GSA25T00015448001.1
MFVLGYRSSRKILFGGGGSVEEEQEDLQVSGKSTSGGNSPAWKQAGAAQKSREDGNKASTSSTSSDGKEGSKTKTRSSDKNSNMNSKNYAGPDRVSRMAAYRILIVWVLVPVGALSVLGHKELRFIFLPIVALLTYLAFIAAERKASLKAGRSSIGYSFLLLGFVAVQFAMCGARTLASLYNYPGGWAVWNMQRERLHYEKDLYVISSGTPSAATVDAAFSKNTNTNLHNDRNKKTKASLEESRQLRSRMEMLLRDVGSGARGLLLASAGNATMTNGTFASSSATSSQAAAQRRLTGNDALLLAKLAELEESSTSSLSSVEEKPKKGRKTTGANENRFSVGFFSRLFQMRNDLVDNGRGADIYFSIDLFELTTTFHDSILQRFLEPIGVYGALNWIAKAVSIGLHKLSVRAKNMSDIVESLLFTDPPTARQLLVDSRTTQELLKDKMNDAEDNSAAASKKSSTEVIVEQEGTRKPSEESLYLYWRTRRIVRFIDAVTRELRSSLDAHLDKIHFIVAPVTRFFRLFVCGFWTFEGNRLFFPIEPWLPVASVGRAGSVSALEKDEKEENKLVFFNATAALESVVTEGDRSKGLQNVAILERLRKMLEATSPGSSTTSAEIATNRIPLHLFLDRLAVNSGITQFVTRPFSMVSKEHLDFFTLSPQVSSLPEQTEEASEKESWPDVIIGEMPPPSGANAAPASDYGNAFRALLRAGNYQVVAVNSAYSGIVARKLRLELKPLLYTWVKGV